MTELYMMIGFGLFATLLRFVNYPLPPMIIGFILGGMLENNLGRALKKYQGFDFILERPITLTLLIIATLFLVLPPLLDYVRSKKSA